MWYLPTPHLQAVRAFSTERPLGRFGLFSAPAWHALGLLAGQPAWLFSASVRLGFGLPAGRTWARVGVQY